MLFFQKEEREREEKGESERDEGDSSLNFVYEMTSPFQFSKCIRWLNITLISSFIQFCCSWTNFNYFIL